MSIEVRYDDSRKVDEIVASDCTVHLERLDSQHWCLIIETAQTRGHFTLRRKSSTVACDVIEVSMRPAVETSTGRGKPCTCNDTSKSACGVEQGSRLGELWHCRRAVETSAAPCCDGAATLGPGWHAPSCEHHAFNKL